MKKCQIYWIPVILLLAACGDANRQEPSVHATKYRTVEAGACVEDTVTGLVWELKSDAAGLHDWRNTYSWFNPNEANNELDYRGVPDGGECSGSQCDTWDFLRTVNKAGHCGYFDWRMPTRNELMSISDLSRSDNPPTANLDYFPFMQADEYWTGFDYGMQYQSAWAWNFFYGHDRVDWKKSPKFVRLVRGTAGKLDKVKE
ncbi:MAG: DUF1566 domain-containing protein [Proteobacteria bacterium]|nr:DUF1566 domain-containing protein [Pseudomonadota bacterium]